jgi:hypothetical protein
MQIISPHYRSAAGRALRVQIPLAIVSALMLDGGRIARCCAAALLGFWIVALVIAFRRPWAPTQFDLWLWRWGFLPCFIIALVFAGMWGYL